MVLTEEMRLVHVFHFQVIFLSMFVDCLGGRSAGLATCGGVVGHDAGIDVGLIGDVHCSCLLAVESRREGDEHHIYR